jgi:hypothetical protein
MQPVIDWHKQGILPVGNSLDQSDRCELIQSDFFAVAVDEKSGFLDDKPVHAVLLDIDHSPSHWLNEGNSEFYSESSLRKMATKIVSGGVFGLWSNDLPDEDFVRHLENIFSSVSAHIVSFDNPYSGGESTNSVYIATV